MFSEIIKNISNREIALLIWLSVILITCLLSTGIRKSILGILKILFAKNILASIFALIINTIFFVFIFHKLKLWDISLFKDTIFWFVGVGFITQMNVNKANDIAYFKNFILDTLKWTIFIEFIMNFASFSLTSELIILPLLTITSLMQIIAANNSKHKPVEKLMKNFNSYFSLFVLCYSVYETIKLYKDFISFPTLKTFLLPIFLSLTFIPFIYFYNLIVKYEALWMILRFNIQDIKVRNKVKLQILWIANFNINKVVSITQNIAKPINLYDDYSLRMIKIVSRGKYIDEDE